MPPEHPLALAAAGKRDRALERARHALGELDARGDPISFQAVARRAGVSRQWLYTQPALRAEIEQLRDPHASHGGRSPGAAADDRRVAAPTHRRSTRGEPPAA